MNNLCPECGSSYIESVEDDFGDVVVVCLLCFFDWPAVLDELYEDEDDIKEALREHGYEEETDLVLAVPPREPQERR